MSTLPAMVYSVLRRQSAEKLRDVQSTVEELLSYSELLPTELRVKLDTFHADIALVLEDQQGLDGTS